MVKRTVTVDSADDAEHVIADASRNIEVHARRMMYDAEAADDTLPIAYELERIRADLDGVIEWFENRRMGRAGT